MQTITSTLLAAAQSMRGEPYVRYRLQDRVARWEPQVTTTGAARVSDGLYTGAALGAGYLVRVKMTAGGSLQSLRAADPTIDAAWTASWSGIATGFADSDVALAEFAVGQLRAFFLQSDGGGGYNLRCIESADSGANWSNEHTVVGGLAGDERLAAAGDAVAVQAGGLTLYREPTFGLTGWATSAAWSGTSWTAPAGVAALYDPSGSRWLIVCCGDGRVTTVVYDGSYSGARAWRPGADGEPADGSAPHSPSAACARVMGEDVYLVTWIDRWSDGTSEWEQPSVRQSRDWVHFGMQVPLHLPATTHRRCALVAAPSLYLWAANECAHATAVLPANPYTAARVPSWFLRTSSVHAAGRLTIEEVAPEVEAIDLDDWAGEVEAAQPLSQVSLQRGYVTSVGNESVSATPYYVTRVTYRQGLDGGRIRYEAVDGWGLLNLWAADHALQWSNRSIAWLLADLAAQVGLGYEDDGCARLSTTLSSFRLPPRVSAAAAVLALLRLSRCVARLTEDAWSKLSVLALPLTSTAADIGDEGELLWGEHGLALVNPTTVTVAGSGVVARDGEPTLAMRQGLDVPRTIEEGRATSATLAENVRDSVLALSRARWRADRVEVHLRPELEPWDRVTLDDPCAAIGDDPDRTVLALKESFSFFSGEYTSTLTLGADLG